MDYLEIAKETMNFINTRKRKGPEGIFWSLEDVAKGRPIYYDQICMYAGASGILCFLLALYDVTKDKAYLDQAEEAGAYLKYRWENEPELKRNFSKYAFSSGWSGAGFALSRLYLVTGKKIYADIVASIISKMKEEAVPGKNGKGYTWSTFPGIVGDGGTLLFLLYAAQIFDNPGWKEFALLAGENLLEQRRDAENGCWYPGVDPAYFGADDNYIDPNFPMGTAGVGFVLMKLYEAGKDPKYLEGNKGIAEFMDSVAVKKGSGKLLPHGLPDRKNLFYLGYCHGPAGTVRYYYKMYESTGDPRYKERLESLVKGLEAVGAPRIRSEGYWNTYNLCCGTAGILNMYLGLWAAFGDENYLKQAEKCGKELAEHGIFESVNGVAQAKWSFALDRIAPGNKSTPIGCFDGAAGIGMALLQLYLAEKGDFHTVRFLDDPFPERKVEK